MASTVMSVVNGDASPQPDEVMELPIVAVPAEKKSRYRQMVERKEERMKEAKEFNEELEKFKSFGGGGSSRSDRGDIRGLHSGLAECTSTLSSVKKEGGKVSDEQLETLFRALCGNTGKDMDSDDSINSEIDSYSAEKIAEMDKEFREAWEAVKRLPVESRRFTKLMRIFRGLESQKEKEARYAAERKERYKLLAPKERKAAEMRRLERIKTVETQMGVVVEVKHEKKETANVTRHQMAKCLEQMKDLLAEKVLAPGKTTCFDRDIKMLNSKTLEENIRIFVFPRIPRIGIFEEDGSLARFLKKTVRRMLRDPNVSHAISSDEIGFKFNTKEAVFALAEYFEMPDKKKEAKDLSIHIKSFVKACHYVDRNLSRNTPITKAVSYAVLESTRQYDMD